MKTAAEALRKWLNSAGEGQRAWEKGIAAVDANPCAKAAAKQDAWLEGVRRAHQEGKFARKLGRITLEDWRAACIAKGGPRYADGIAKGRKKYESFINQFMPYLKSGKDSLPARGTLQQNMQRQAQMVDHIRKFPAAIGILPPGF